MKHEKLTVELLHTNNITCNNIKILAKIQKAIMEILTETYVDVLFQKEKPI